jgi:plasmid maintenance system antidote protein VapI
MLRYQDRVSPASRIGRGEVDQETRERIRKWIVYEMKRRQIDSIREMAGKLDVSHSFLARILNGDQSAGLEMVLRLNRRLHIDAQVLLNEDPPTK